MPRAKRSSSASARNGAQIETPTISTNADFSSSANMLYPREDRTLGTLSFQCRNCQFAENVGPVCIYRNELTNTVGETSGVTQDVASDPTVSSLHRGTVHARAQKLIVVQLPHVNRDCPLPTCQGTDAVFFQSQQRTAETGMVG